MRFSDYKPLTDFIRFAQKIRVNSETGCWEWIAGRYRNGYSKFCYRGRYRIAHRVAYRWFVGRLIEGLEIDHLCKNKCCVNPEHLEQITHRENQRRGNNPQNHQDTSCCPHGHEYTAENTYTHSDGRRSCRTCQRLAALKYYYDKRESQGFTVGPHARDKTHCKYGHPFDELNTRILQSGERQCKICQRKRHRDWKQRKMECNG